MGRPLARACALVVAATVAVAAIPAQLRHPCLGTVVDGDGKPVAKAAVTLVWTPGSGRPGELDVVRTTADERGGFKADVVVSHAYSAWAVGPVDADGTYLVSEVTDRAAAGVVLELAASQRMAPRRFTCTGFEPWLIDGVVRLRWYCDGRQDLGVDLRPTPDGKGVLPPGPWATGMIALLDAKGGIQQLQRVDSETAAPTVEFEPPYESELHVVDEKNQPVAGAVVEQMLRQYGTSGDAVFRPFLGYRWRHAGTSDAAGRARLRLVRDGAMPVGWLRIEAGGVRSYAVDSSVSEAKELRVVVPRLEVQPGVVRGIRDGETVFAQVSTRAEFQVAHGSSSLVMELPLTVSAEGKLGIAPTPVTCSESALLMQLLPQREGIPRHLLLAGRSEPAAHLPALDLDKLRTWHLRAVDAANNPLPGATVKVIGTTETRSHRSESMDLILDHGGRADLLLDDSEWGVYVTIGTAHALAFVDAGSDGGELLVRLEPLPTARLRVVDVDGKPVAHARIKVRGGAPIIDRTRRSELRAELGGLIASTTGRAARSGADGAMMVPVQDWNRLRLTAQVRAGLLVSSPFDLVAGEEVVDIVVR